jgi:hypothetical protein
MPSTQFNAFLNDIKLIVRSANYLHLGVRSLSGLKIYENDKEFGGSAILQRTIIKGFCNILYVYFGVWQALQERDGAAPASEVRMLELAHSNVNECIKEMERARDDLIVEAGEFERDPPLGPMVTREAVTIMLLDRLSQNVHGTGSFHVGDIYERVIEKLVSHSSSSISGVN